MVLGENSCSLLTELDGYSGKESPPIEQAMESRIDHFEPHKRISHEPGIVINSNFRSLGHVENQQDGTLLIEFVRECLIHATRKGSSRSTIILVCFFHNAKVGTTGRLHCFKPVGGEDVRYSLPRLKV